jgi:hypothetical protein
LTRAADQAELNEVEGWGDQHVYLFRVPKEISQDAMWSSQATGVYLALANLQVFSLLPVRGINNL